LDDYMVRAGGGGAGAAGGSGLLQQLSSSSADSMDPIAKSRKSTTTTPRASSTTPRAGGASASTSGRGGGNLQSPKDRPATATVTVSVLVEGVPAAVTAADAAAGGLTLQTEEVTVRAELWGYGSTADGSNGNGTGAVSDAPLAVLLGAPQPSADGCPRLPGRARADAAEDPDVSECGLVGPQDGAVVTLHGALPSPWLWSAECPHLYLMVLSVHASAADAEVRPSPSSRRALLIPEPF